ncbi:phage lytic cycle repressor MrpR family protein [Clostridium tagluense]|uniref:MrpR N-terminal core-binding domain-containing protein n=1 Tax=Clostridium tagluense TaxID=360422 RepID=A0A401UTU8_9CLOT|nr:hypothetical protein [Clostridium tagluense]GCD12878.1 hypothetical protein Ctaglu_45010 [Clostridium tagluense]
MITKEIFDKMQGELGQFQENKQVYLIDRYKDNKKNTVLTYFRLFKLFKGMEEVLGKDIYSFNDEEIIDAISRIPTFSKRMVNSIGSLLDNYIEWACQRGLNPTRRNPMQHIKVKTHLEQMINTTVLAQRFISKKNLYDMREEIEKNSDKDIDITAQDFLPIILPFYGIYGKECSEISNLRIEDIDRFKNLATVRDDFGNERIVEIDEQLVDLIIEADEQKEYKKRENWIHKLTKNGYVLKSTKGDGRLNVNGIRIRFSKVLKLYNKSQDEISRLTMKSVISSGKYARLRKLEQVKGELTDQDFRDMQVEFGDNPKSYFGLKEDYYFAYKDKVE